MKKTYSTPKSTAITFACEDTLLNTSLTGQSIGVQGDPEENGANALSNKRDMWQTEGWLKK